MIDLELATSSVGRGVQRGEMRGGFLTYFFTTSYSPTFGAKPKIATPNFLRSPALMNGGFLDDFAFMTT